jgi:hypothetical protein
MLNIRFSSYPSQWYRSAQSLPYGTGIESSTRLGKIQALPPSFSFFRTPGAIGSGWLEAYARDGIGALALRA